MEKVAVTVLGCDRPGIVCETSSLLAAMNCNIEDISQTVIQDEFAGIFLVSMPRDLSLEKLDGALQQGLQPLELHCFVKTVYPRPKDASNTTSEPFVIITIGPDRVGLIATLTKVMKNFQVNITNLRFVNKAPSFPEKTVSIYEVDIPQDVPLQEFTAELQTAAAGVGLEVNVQHKNIFEDICRL